MPVLVKTQFGFRVYNDDGSESTATAHAAENANDSIVRGSTFRLRIGMGENVGVGLSNLTNKLQYAKNGGAYVDVTTSSSSVKAVATSQSYSNHDTTTQHLTAPVGETFDSTGTIQSNDGVSGLYSDNSAHFFEFEWCLQIISADMAATDYVEFKMVPSSGTAITYTVIPKITAIDPPPVITSTRRAQGAMVF